MKPDLWLPLYVADYQADTTRLSTEQHGAYLLLIMDYWRNGPLPDDDQILAQVTKLTSARWKLQRPAIEPFFQIVDRTWRHKRIDIEIEKATENQDRRSSRAKAAADARWKAGGNAYGNASGNASGNATSMQQELLGECPSPSPSPSPASSQSPPPEKPDAQASPGVRGNGAGKTVETWNSYCQAYRDRYGVEPLRNAKVNGQLGKLIDQVGIEEAPKIAAFYLEHNGPLYVSSGHAVDLLLRDCQKLRTEMVTGKRITRSEARQAETKDAIREQAARVGRLLGQPS